MRPAAILVCAAALLAAGCSSGDSSVRAQAAAPKSCAWKAGWQKLANRTGAPVYCPTWLPDPLTGQLGGRWNNIDSVGKDRSYLESFVWQETGPGASSGELHVNLRGYPGRTAIPTCTDVNTVAGVTKRTPVPCFADPRGARKLNGLRVTMYTVNQDADQWHVLYLWRRGGNMYTVSEHVAAPLTFAKVVRYLDRITRGLVLVQPAA